MRIVIWTSTLCLLGVLVVSQSFLEIRRNSQHKQIEQRLDRLENPGATNLFALTAEIQAKLEKDGKEIVLFYSRDGRVFWQIKNKPKKKGWFR